MAPSNVLFEAPSTAAVTPPSSWGSRSTSSFDPYHPESYMPNATSPRSGHSYIPLLPTQSQREQERLIEPQQPRGPRLLQKQSKRTGKAPGFLSVAESRAPVKIDDESPGLYNPYDPYDRRVKLSSASEDAFLNTPPFPNGFPSTPSKSKRHPIPFASRGFEPPEWKKIFLHVFLCAVAYPFLLLVVVIAKNRSIFWCRTIVGIGCGIVGFALGVSLIELAKTFLEAATWATLIHQSNVPTDAPGVRLRDLSSTVEHGTTLWSALRLMWARWMYSGTARRARRAYDKRPWSLFIFFFLSTATLASVLPFLLGRITDIQTKIVHESRNYREVPVKADLTPDDIERAAELVKAFNTYALTWTISPFSALGNLPPAITLDHNGEDIYFAEVAPAQLRPDGTGFGTFKQETTAASIDTNRVSSDISNSDTSSGTMLRFPRWGTRIRCKRISNGDVNIVPLTPNNFTYVFVPRDDVRGLFQEFKMDVPPVIELPFNRTAVVGNDTIPSNVDFNSLLDVGKSSAGFFQNGVGHAFKSYPVTMGKLFRCASHVTAKSDDDCDKKKGAEGFGWISLETLLVRINDAFAPQGKFQRKSEQTVPTEIRNNGVPETVQARIGYDAAVCVQLYEPYVVEVYNSSFGLPNTMRIVSKGGHLTDDIVDGQVVTVRKGDSITDTSVNRELNSTKLASVYETLHGNSINQILKDNGRDADYAPSPTVVSYTGGSGPGNYTELCAECFGKAKAKSDSANMLPYFAGSGDAVAWAFSDQVLATARLEKVFAAALLGGILIMGLLAGFFVPKLPMDVPRRSFTLYSWLTAFQAGELVGDRPPITRGQMHLDDIEKEYGDLKFRYSGFR
ncbi:hypothetical protein V5O48_010834 [Marasmius crinis-equi]|uniref:Uncharacterized protein n=1 Tax=Marasmius crinis-equi TaxID=585013 RepID=A0ABR3F7T9_9AGAR